MKKTILSTMMVAAVVATMMAGCSQPEKMTYKKGQTGYTCGYNNIVLTPIRGGTVHSIRSDGRDEFGFLTFKGTSRKAIARMHINNYGNITDSILYADGTFVQPRPVDTNGRPRPNELWSFRKQPNGKYFFGHNKSPNTKHVLGLTGSWCERVH